MKILALMMFLASTSAFSLPDDLVVSASPACKDKADLVVSCQEREVYRTFDPCDEEIACHPLVYPPVKVKVGAEGCIVPMNTYLLCEVGALRQQVSEPAQPPLKRNFTDEEWQEILNVLLEEHRRGLSALLQLLREQETEEL